jgi:hypothetical protein
VHRQVKDLRAYVHEGMHELGNKLNAMSLQSQDREERESQKRDAHWKGLSKEIDEKVGATHERINELTRSVGELVGELRAASRASAGGRAKVMSLGRTVSWKR